MLKFLFLLALLSGGWQLYGHYQKEQQAADLVRSQQELGLLDSKKGITLFTATWCGYCTRLKGRLDASAVPYVEYDIDTSPQGKMYFAQNNLHVVPLMIVDGNTIIGYNKDKMAGAFANAGFTVTGL